MLIPFDSFESFVPSIAHATTCFTATEWDALDQETAAILASRIPDEEDRDIPIAYAAELLWLNSRHQSNANALANACAGRFTRPAARCRWVATAIVDLEVRCVFPPLCLAEVVRDLPEANTERTLTISNVSKTFQKFRMVFCNQNRTGVTVLLLPERGAHLSAARTFGPGCAAGFWSALGGPADPPHWPGPGAALGGPADPLHWHGPGGALGSPQLPGPGEALGGPEGPAHWPCPEGALGGPH